MKTKQINSIAESRRLRWPFQCRSAAWLSVLTLCLCGFLLPARGQQDPRLTNTNNPADTNVSVGATVRFVLSVTSTNFPLTYQWQHEGTNLPAATSSQLILANVTVAHAGGYRAWITNASGAFTNTRTATLKVDPTFAKIVTGAIVTDNLDGRSAAWGDYDGDGDLDVVVGGGVYWPYSEVASLLYTNRGNGTFVRAANSPFTSPSRINSVNWADADNDGDLDLWTGIYENTYPTYFTNQGNARFTRAVANATWIENGVAIRGGMQAWADYDGDGLLDLVVVPGGYDTATTWPLALLHNSGNGRFTAMTNSPLYEVKKYSSSASWVDFDDDGDPDLFCSRSSPTAFRNDGGTLTPIIAADLPFLSGANMDVWADFDNDGDQDRLGAGTPPQLWRNDGPGGWTLMAGPPYDAFQDVQSSYGAWGDYDNDGDVDLFVTSGAYDRANRNHLFRNDGPAGFVEVLSGSPVNELANSAGCSWVDYDNDGALDLFVVNADNGSRTTWSDFLYHNNGNTNHWLEVKLTGRVSNRSAIGAKVRVKAVIGGKEVWQLRTLSAQAFNQELVAHFGLGDATTVDALRIEWPSGIVQKVTGVNANQILSLEEELFLVTSSMPEVKPGTVDVPKGGAVTLIVSTNPPNTTYQWQFNGQDISGATNASLFIPSLSAADLGRYTALVTTTGLQVFARPVMLGMLGQAVISGPYATTPQSVSVGAPVVLRVIVSGAPTLVLQWQHNGVDIPAAVNPTALTSELRIEGAALADAGAYRLVASNAVDTVVSAALSIQVDPTFVRITSGAIVTDREPSDRSSWCDYDGDGFQDLFVANQYNNSSGKNSLYHNNRDGTFTKITTNALSATARSWSTGAWADVDNDGDPDIYVGGAGSFQAVFYRNDGGGQFTAVSIAPTLDAAGRDSWLVAWGDYDNDGWVDLFIPTGALPSHRLFRNLGDLNFKSMTAAEVGALVDPNSHEGSAMATWSDYDNDGDLDIYIYQPYHHSALYLNSGSGFFTRTFVGSIANVTDPNGDGKLPSWADYDNDGYLDAFVSWPGFVGTLHHNLGGTNSVVVPQSGLEIPADNTAAIWGDYDNDGNLDLFLVNNPRWPYVSVRGANLLFRGNGDGTFTQVDVGSPIWEGSDEWDCNWIDYDNDGFLDLFIAAGPNVPEVNYLYRNNLPATGNTNHWLKVSLVGKASNAAGIGAKVRVTANIRGNTVTQLRAVESPGYIGSNQGLLAHFGLGDATNVATLRIEWPSGIVQELGSVTNNQFLTVVESQGYSPTNTRPTFTGATKDASGSQLSFTEPAPGARYILEASTNMVTWTKLLARTSIGVATNYTDTRATNYPSRFYRLQVP